jgi:hypothetical protein
MKYFASCFGFLLMFIIPNGLIYAFRKKLALSGITHGKLNKSPLRHNYQIFVLVGLSILTYALIIYGYFYPNEKTCVAE